MFYESLLLTAVLFIAGFVFVSLTDYPHAPQLRPVYRIFLLGTIVGYFAWFWLHGGQTLAMKTWRLKLVPAEGKRLNFARACLRLALAAAGLALGGLSLAWALFDRDRQFLHDRLAGTRIVLTGKTSPFPFRGKAGMGVRQHPPRL
jgi:uncharacterized RDD family membrane protein YckC